MAEYFFGIAGWSYSDWRGIVYPPDAPSRFDELAYISQYFDVIELNNTFYRIPDSRMTQSWVRRTQHNDRFRFTAKMYQGFTHDRGEWNEKECKQLLWAMEPLISSNRLGALLAQYPASFRIDSEGSKERLQMLAARFRDYPLVVEFRHRSWTSPDVLDWLGEQGIGFCNVDEPGFRHLIRPSAVVTSAVAYVRFHGRNFENWYAKGRSRDARYDYMYSEEELDQWLPRIEEMGSKAKDVYVIGNNHFRGQAPANILQLESKIKEGPVAVPESMMERYPQLRKISRPSRKKQEKQQSLFSDEN